MANSMFRLLRCLTAQPPGAASTVVVADVENITRGAQDLGGRLDIPRLGVGLRAENAGELWAVLSTHGGTVAIEREFEADGWRVHRSSCRSAAGTANADTAIAVVAGQIAAGARVATMVLLTGDGELGTGIAETVKMLVGPRLRVVVGAFGHSCSRRLDPRRNPLVDGWFALEPCVAVELRDRRGLHYDLRPC